MMSRSSAIRDFCRHCLYDPIGGTGSWRHQTENCTKFDCSLYPFRPVTILTLREGRNSLESSKDDENRVSLNVGQGD